MAVNSTNSPKSAAQAIARTITGATVRDSASAFRGLLYFPVKVGSRSPITVYEAERGKFEGDVTVIVAFDGRADAKSVVGNTQDKFAAFAKANSLAEGADPGDATKRGWKMTCSQVVAACESVAPAKEEQQQPVQSISAPVFDLDAILKDPATRAKLLAALLGS
jgi:hypothetical protein